MSEEHNGTYYQSKRLSLTDLRKINKFKDVNDDEGEAIIDDALALARMILDIIN